MSIRIAYYYSVNRAGRPVSAQENASRRSGKVAQRDHARSYGQAYTGCLITNNRNEKHVDLSSCVDEIQSICTVKFLQKFHILQLSTDRLLNICILHYISFTQLAEQTCTYISYTRSTLYIRHAAAWVCSLPLHVHSFFRLHLRASHRRASISSVRGMNHWSLAFRLDVHTFFDNLAKFPIQAKLMFRWWNGMSTESILQLSAKLRS